MNASWQWLTLDDVLIRQVNRKKVQQGWSPKCHDFPAATGQWGVLKTTAIQAGRFEPEHNKALPDHLAPKPGIEVESGDLLITCAGPRSRCGVPTLVRSTPERLMMSGKMYRFRADDRLDPRFLELWLLSPDAQRQIDSMKTGISDSGLNLTHARFTRLPVPVPPLAEQHQIVDLLEDHLSRLDASSKAVADSLARLKSLRDSALLSIVDQAKRDEGVATRAIGDLAIVRSGMTPLRGNKAFYDGGTIPWITSGDLHQGRITAPTQFVTQEALDETSLKVIPAGSLLLAMYGEGKTRGTAAELGIDATTNQACAAITLHEPELRQWVRLILDANYTGLRRLAAGGVQPNLNLSLIKAIEVPVPSAETRRMLISRITGIDEARERMKAELLRAQRRGMSLRRSLLAAAFSGGLAGNASDHLQAEEMVNA